MSAYKATLLTLIAGLLFWSSWIPGTRLAMPRGGAVPPTQWHKPPVRAERLTTQERLRRAQRLGDVVREPARLSKADLDRAKADWGPDAPRMLGSLNQASH